MTVKTWMRSALIATAALLPAVGVAGTYTIDPTHTFPSLEFSHMGISVWRGKFNKTSGTVTLDLAARKGSAEIVIDVASIDFGLDAMNEHALKPDWLNVEKFPTMTYKGTLKFEGDKATSMEGELTLLGVTKPVTLKINSLTCIVHPYYKKEVCGADAEGELDRADFGLTQYTDNGAGKIRFQIQVEAM